jgi:hypothetical protein
VFVRFSLLASADERPNDRIGHGFIRLKAIQKTQGFTNDKGVVGKHKIR